MRVENTLARNPRMARAFDLYIDCRTVQLFHLRVEKDRGKKVENKIVEFVTGYSQLPVAGGMLEQPAWVMRMFDHFRSGENAAAAKNLK
jgi:hypothetical protein